MDYRITVTIAEHGYSDEWAEKCLDALVAKYPEAGPVVSQNTASGHLSVVVAVEATDPWAASNLGARMLGECLDSARLPLAQVVDVNVTLVEYEDSSENVRDLVGV